MSLELLDQILAAENQAEQIRAEAQQKAREMLRSVEESTLSSQRDAQLFLRDEIQRTLENAQIATQDEIKTLDVRTAAEQSGVRAATFARVPQAGQLIFERIVSDGHR